MKRANIEVAFPLHWPDGFKRTAWSKRSRFKIQSFAVARDLLLDELRQLGAQYVVLSTNIQLRNDGLPYADFSEPKDRGACAYFNLGQDLRCIPCDAWDKVRDNVLAIAHTVEALRGIKRWGSGEMMARAFSAFQALPPAPATDWRTVLGVDRGITHPTIDFVRERYRSRALDAHPDRGGTHDDMVRLNLALEAATRDLGVA